ALPGAGFAVRAFLHELAVGGAQGPEQAPGHLEGAGVIVALEVTESFFWTFCADYLELVKERAYGEAGAGPASAVAGGGPP
ncbi:hypothetical protein, partial [Cryobacterium sp. RTS3]|uniref:hypothetical protein n=1 Tax=Cryobacterium sp. RTS3 TaxID=3048643 RepID=UPI002B235236